MSQDIAFSARCIRCGNRSISKPHRLALESKIDCQVCGYSATVLEFADIPVLEAMLQDTRATRLVH